MPDSFDPSWRYGAALFPLSPILSLATLRGLRAFVSIPATETGVLFGIAAFLVTVLSSWLAILVAAVVAVSAYLDARAFAGRENRSPNRYAVGAVGLVHLAAAAGFLVLYLISVPSFLYYFHRRRRRVRG